MGRRWRQDSAYFAHLFHLPVARMRVVPTLAGARSPWVAFGEEVLDVEMVHALAPGAPGPATKMASPAPGPPAGYPTCRPTPAAMPTWPWSCETATGA